MHFVSTFLFVTIVTKLHSFPLLKRPGVEFAEVSKDSFKRLKEEPWRSTDFDRRAPHGHRDYPTNINATKLRALLVDSFDAQYMSEARPSRAWQSSGNTASEDRDTFQAQRQDFLGTFYDRAMVVENKSELENVDFWLWNLTRCNVQPLWRDFGTKVWPRYVNVGKCPEKPTCSIPKGMRCRPNETKTVQLLYWVCSPASKMASAKNCLWSAFQTEVIQECQCSC